MKQGGLEEEGRCVGRKGMVREGVVRRGNVYEEGGFGHGEGWKRRGGV